MSEKKVVHYHITDFEEYLIMHRDDFDLEAVYAIGFRPDVVILLAPERYVDYQRAILELLATADFGAGL